MRENGEIVEWQRTKGKITAKKVNNQAQTHGSWEMGNLSVERQFSEEVAMQATHNEKEIARNKTKEKRCKILCDL
jgi:hypothetical protein